MVRGEPPCEGRQKTSGAQSGGLVSGQGAAAGQGTKARHRVPPRRSHFGSANTSAGQLRRFAAAPALATLMREHARAGS